MWLIPQSLASALASECSKRGLPPDSGISDESLAFYAMSSGTATLRPFSWRGWKSRRWSRHLFGPATLIRHCWTTPQAHDITERGAGQIPTSAAGNACLARDARTWESPEAHMRKQVPTRKGDQMRWETSEEYWSRQPEPDLTGAAWPTPAGRDQKGANSEEHATLTGGGRKHMDQLPNFVAYSPQAQAIRNGATSSPDGPSSPRLRLNPNFVDWLMGWPDRATSTDLTASDAVEMASFHSKLQRRLSSLLGERE